MGESVIAGAPNAHGRMLYLQAVSRCVPAAISELMALNLSDRLARRDWAERRGFTDDWIRYSAMSHALLWREQPEMTGRWLIVTAAGWVPTPKAPPQWDPHVETEAHYRRRQQAYIEDVKRTTGFEPTPTKSDLRHWEWLALHHVDEWKYEQIHKRYSDPDGSPDIPAISRAITDSARLIGLTLRPGRGRKLSRGSR